MKECPQYQALQFYCIYKELGCAIKYFLEVGASTPSGAATATNLNKENRKMEGFG